VRLDRRQGPSFKSHAQLLKDVQNRARINAEFQDLSERLEITQQMVNDLAMKRDKILLDAYREPGTTLDSLAERFGIHRTRVGRLINRAKERYEAHGVAENPGAQHQA
jgi:hypothetical protein